jgi:DNA-binding transcriptional MerR regulator
MPPAAKPEKSPRRQKKPVGRLYWSISEVAELTAVKPHVLRYWETEFPTLKPKKNSAGNRHYRERDIELVLAIKHLLHTDQFTIKGARQKLTETRKVRDLIEQLEIPFARANQRQLLKEIRRDLLALKGDLEEFK